MADDDPGEKEDELKNLLVREIRSARSNDDTELADKRRKALAYFNGDISEDLPAETGRSSVVSRDLADAVGWLLPQLVRIYLASGEMVIAEPVGEEDDDMASAATSWLNYVFLKDNPGYRILRDATWDALVLANGKVKLWHDDTAEYTTSFHSGITDEQLAELEADDGLEITHQTTTQVPGIVDLDEMGQPVMGNVNVHDLKIKRLKSKGRRRIDCIPPEDYLRSDDPPGTERPRFEAQRWFKTRSELIQMGFDRDKVDALTSANDDSPEQNARKSGYVPPRDVADRSMETIEGYECYVQTDIDDDGIAETIKANYAGPESGGTLLDWEVWEDEGPFFDIPCDPVPHRIDGKSIADETMDMQRVKSVLWRQGLDNTYAANNPQRFVTGKIINPDELFSPNFGGNIFGEPGSTVTPLSIPFVANHAYEAMGYADEVIQRRTGVGRQSMALDPEALQNTTAEASRNNRDAQVLQVDLIARDMAELGWKNVFRALLKLEIRHQDQARTIRMGNKSVTIDPRSWNADMDVTINVGLGTGSRDRDLAMLGNVLQTQLLMADRFLAAGATDDAIDMLPKIIDTMVKMAESAGLRNPQSYYPEYTDEKVAKLKQMAADRAAQPNPQIQADIAKTQATLEASKEEAKIKAQGDVVKNQAELEADLQTREADRQNAIAVENVKQGYEDRRFFAQLEQTRELELLKLSMVEETATGPDGQPTKTVKSKGDKASEALTQRFDALVELLAQHAAQNQQNIQTLAQYVTAPSEIHVDPVTGKKQARKVLN